MAIRLFLEFNNEIIQFPVNPESLSITQDSSNKVAEIIKLGEITLLKDPKLRACSVKGFFPSTSDGPYVLTKGLFEPPSFYIDFIQKVKEAKKPARFIITDTKINMLVSLEAFEYGMEGGTDDISFNLDLKEYRPYGVKIITLTPPAGQTSSGAGQGAATGTVSNASRAPEAGKFTIGDMVVVNGKYYQDSYGGGRSGTFKDFTGKISHIVTKAGRKLPYHITTPDGGWRGWVSKDQIIHK